MTRSYPAVFEPDDNGTFLVSFPDFPEAHTFGETMADARLRAADCLQTIIDAYGRDGQALPAPSGGDANTVELVQAEVPA